MTKQSKLEPGKFSIKPVSNKKEMNLLPTKTVIILLGLLFGFLAYKSFGISIFVILIPLWVIAEIWYAKHKNVDK